MNIIRALKSLLEGKKVRHQDWEKGYYITYNKDTLKLEDNNGFEFCMYADEILEFMQYKNNGWKVLKEKQPTEPWIKLGDWVEINSEYLLLKVVYCDENKAFVVFDDLYNVIFKKDKGKHWFIREEY